MKKTENAQIMLNFQSEVTVIPASAIAFVDKAKKFDIKVIMLIASSERYRSGNYLAEIASALECDESAVSASVSFWNGTGVISVGGESGSVIVKKPAKEEEQSQPKRAKVTELPQYTSSELTLLLEKHTHVVGLIDECQNILGKIFTAADIKVLMGLIDFLGLDNDYVLVLMHYAARKGMKSMRYIEKIAVSCLDDGFTDAAVLQAALREREEKEDIEAKIKNIFGAGARKFSAKEKKCVEAWISTYNFGLDIIERAYDITISATSKPSIPYAHAILERWFNEGIKSVEQIDALIAQREIDKAGESSSFNIDEFFNAALDRSYANKK
mgnify:FL=1